MTRLGDQCFSRARTHQRVRALGFSAALLSFLLGGNAARGEPAGMDDKVYHASICKPEDEAKTFYIPGVYTATDSSPTYTSCPLIRDQVGAADDLNWVVVELYNDDNTIPCWLYTQVEDTGSSTILDYDFDEATQSGFTQVEFSGVSSTAGNEGAYLVSCLLSNGSQIYQILVREKI